ncbi:hypothetical protein MUK42_20922 [Musa troglodytarum]|uniref:Uncharacterized protein n=1 Tax=Musa troglodytarum TaxID=320322 RepID=A0A9E7K4Z6_9LILI|nr:hypothetical protein MUK42_20922 [Musa troglodytarum]
MTVRKFTQSLCLIDFCTPSRKFKILTIPNLFVIRKLYNLSFAKKHDGHKVYAKSMFDRFLCKVSEIYNIYHSELIKPRNIV